MVNLKDIFKSKRQFKFPYCKKCGKMPSKMGNFTNMELAGIINPRIFDKKYGLMCVEHAAELTFELMDENQLTEKDLSDASKMAHARLMKDLQHYTSRKGPTGL